MFLVTHAISLICLVGLVSANTETILLPIPHYYNIPAHPSSYVHHLESPVHAPKINETHSLLKDYPIGNKLKQVSVSKSAVSVDYNDKLALPHTLLVKLNNYSDQTFKSDDKLYVKLCWPATEPFDVDLSYQFIQEEEGEELDLYLIINYESDAHTYLKDDRLDSFSFNLHISNSPWDLIDLIVYLVDLLIIIVTIILPNLKKLV